MYFELLSLIGLYFFWMATQKFLSTDIHTKDKIIDRIHDSYIGTAINDFLNNHPQFAKWNIAITTFLIDANMVYIIASGFIYADFRPIYMILCGICLRQLCQFINRLPSPNNVVWFDPGFPTLFMVYAAENDFFFSGHTLISLITGVSIYLNSVSYFAKFYAVFFIVYEIGFVIVSRSHYFMDIYAAISTYFMLNYFMDLLL